MKTDKQIEMLRLLGTRLEHLSVDSRWARRASGLRGNIIKVIEQEESGEKIPSKRMELLIDRSFTILRLAAHDIPDLKDLKGQK